MAELRTRHARGPIPAVSSPTRRPCNLPAPAAVLPAGLFILGNMMLSRRVSWFLVAFGVWSWIVWTTFAKNLWKDASGLAFTHGDHSRPTAYFWVHLTLAVVSFLLGTGIGLLGLRGLRGVRAQRGVAS